MFSKTKMFIIYISLALNKINRKITFSDVCYTSDVTFFSLNKHNKNVEFIKKEYAYYYIRKFIHVKLKIKRLKYFVKIFNIFKYFVQHTWDRQKNDIFLIGY